MPKVIFYITQVRKMQSANVLFCSIDITMKILLFVLKKIVFHFLITKTYLRKTQL